ncbi:MAG: hypothetical protein IT464_06980 [Planctomycetes bacterium]|nr:hypothetical protein [Planctomycetota bacterium]
MPDNAENCTTCGPNGLKFSRHNGRGRIEVPQDFLAETLGSIDAQIAEGMAMAEAIQAERAPTLDRVRPDYEEPSPSETKGAVNLNNNFTLAESGAADVFPSAGYPSDGGIEVFGVLDKSAATKAAGLMATYWQATGKDFCEDVDYPSAFDGITSAQEDCSKLAGSARILCDIRNDCRTSFATIYSGILRDKNAWLWELRRQFIEVCKGRKDASKNNKK